jgi:hypothetical protein
VAMRQRLLILAVVASLGVAGSALAGNSTSTAPRHVAIHQRLSPSRDPGKLPFTGSHLAAFTSLGIALIAAGLLLRLTARKPFCN